MLLHLLQPNHVSFYQFSDQFVLFHLISLQFLQKLSIGRRNNLHYFVLFDFPCKSFGNLQILSKRNQPNFLHFNHSLLHHQHVICNCWFCQRSRHLSRSSIWFDWLWNFLLWRQHLSEHNNGHPNTDQLRTSKGHHKRCNRQIQFKSLHSPFCFNCWLDWLLDCNVHCSGRSQICSNPSQTQLDGNCQRLHCSQPYFPWFS